MAVDQYATITKSGIDPVQLLIKEVKHNFDKEITVLAYPKQSPPLTYLIDLKKLKEVITVTGFLIDESSDRYYEKKQRLRDIMQESGTMTLEWDSNDSDQAYTVNIIKAEIKEVPGAIDADDYYDLGDTKVLNVMIEFAIGTHRG